MDVLYTELGVRARFVMDRRADVSDLVYARRLRRRAEPHIVLEKSHDGRFAPRVKLHTFLGFGSNSHGKPLALRIRPLLRQRTPYVERAPYSAGRFSPPPVSSSTETSARASGAPPSSQNAIRVAHPPSTPVARYDETSADTPLDPPSPKDPSRVSPHPSTHVPRSSAPSADTLFAPPSSKAVGRVAPPPSTPRSPTPFGRDSCPTRVTPPAPPRTRRVSREIYDAYIRPNHVPDTAMPDSHMDSPVPFDVDMESPSSPVR